MREIADDLEEGVLVEDLSQGRRKIWHVRLPREEGGYTEPVQIRENADGTVEMNAAMLERGQGGSLLYHLAATYAHNNNKVFIGDREGVSPDAKIRRTENLLSSALRYGTTEHIRPHPDQNLNWKEGDDAHNMQMMVDTVVKNVEQNLPQIKDIEYDFDKRAFWDTRNDREFTDEEFIQLATSPGAGKVRAGRRTLKRTALLRSLSRRAGEEGSTLLSRLLLQSDQKLDPALRRIFYRRSDSPAPAGLSTSEARNAIEQAFGERTARRVLDGDNAPLTLVATELGLPRSLDDGGVIRGVHDPSTGKTYLVARNLTPETVRGTFLHELGVHHGLVQREKGGPGLLTQDKFNELVRRLKTLEKVGDKATRETIAEARQAVEDAKTPESQKDEELVAYTIEKWANRQDSAPNGIRAWLQRLFQAIKNAVFRIGRIAPSKMSLDDMVSLAEGAAQKVRGTPDVTAAGEPAYARSEETQSAYENRIDELYADEPANRQGIKILDSSDVLGMLGYKNLPVHLAEGKVIDGRENHQLTAEHWKRIPGWLDNPVAVFDSETVPGRLVLIAPELHESGVPIAMIVDPDFDGDIANIHLLVNAYERGSPIPLGRWVDGKLLRYVDQKESPAFAGQSGLRLPGTDQLRGYGHKVYTNRDLVKYRKQQGEEPKFSKAPPTDPNILYARGEGQRPSDEALRILKDMEPTEEDLRLPKLESNLMSSPDTPDTQHP